MGKKRMNTRELVAANEQQIISDTEKMRSEELPLGLEQYLVSKGIDTRRAVLMDYGSCFGQGCEIYLGKVLSTDKQFYEFSVDLSLDGSFQDNGNQEWIDCTETTDTSSRVRGIGASHGFLALKVLHPDKSA